MLIELKDENYEDILNQDKLVILDFFAYWCGPCMKLGETMHEIAEEHPEIDVLKVNVDKFQEIAAKYQVYSIPDVYIYKNGKIVDHFNGTRPKSYIEEIVNKY